MATIYSMKENCLEYDPIKVQKYLGCVECPASQQDFVDQLRELGQREFSGPDEVRAALRRS